MQNNPHPLIEILKLSDHGFMTKETNFELFTKLRITLTEDGKPTALSGKIGTQDWSKLSNPAELSGDIESSLLACLIKNWCMAAIEPFITELNKHVNGKKITIVMTKYTYSASECIDAYLYIKGTADELKEVIKPERVPAIRALISEWDSTFDVIGNGNILLSALYDLENP
jgi:hypothetical protein